MIDVPIAEAHNRLSALLKKVQKGPIMLTRRGKPVGVILSPEEYDRLRQFEAFSQVVQLSHTLRESGVSAADLYRTSRDELEGRS
ncbi:MAG TPA: type II toxin-antitoxin system Phd/YefM family antitoxin [Anaerolineae bacterium]|nr:type II toxin-antitoxin system Phd/YefM family antitoxin [Anaerolineae bacterium]